MARMILSRSSSDSFAKSPESMAEFLDFAQEHASDTGHIVDVVDDDGELLAIVTPETMVDNPCDKVIVRRENTRAGKTYLQRAAVCESTHRDYGFERGYKFLRYHDDHPKRAQELERQRKARQRDESRRATRQEAASHRGRAMVAVSPPPKPEYTPAPLAPEYDISELVGSPRQVAWAEKIRERFLASIEPALEQARNDSSISHLIRDEVARMLETELRAEARQTSAVRWIDRYRDFPPTVRDLASRANTIVRRHEGELRTIARQRLESERKERQRETEMPEIGSRSDFEGRREARQDRLEAMVAKTRDEAESATAYEEPELAILEGTPKQIAWATDLRAQWMTGMRAKRDYAAAHSKGTEIAGAAHRLIVAAAAVTSAKAWIDTQKKTWGPVQLASNKNDRQLLWDHWQWFPLVAPDTDQGKTKRLEAVASPVTFTILSTPSRSKGWARWSAEVAGQSVLDTKSGTQWGSGREGDVRTTIPLESGAIMEVTIQVELSSGKGRTARKELFTNVERLIVRPGATSELEYRPGSQGLTLQIEGAEPA